MPTVLLVLLAACTQDKQPDSGVFVGNPGKLELTAARSVDFDLSGVVLLDELLLGACGSNESVSAPLEGRELTLIDDGSLRFELDEPLQVPPGAWCSMELVLGEADLAATTVSEAGYELRFDLAFEDVTVRVSGPEFVVDDQELSLQIGEPEWLEALYAIGADDPSYEGVVDVLQVAPEIHGALRDVLERQSALYLTSRGDGEDTANTDLAPGQQAGSEPVWSGNDRETTPTSTGPTDTGVEPTDTGIEPPQVDLYVDPITTLQAEVQSVGTPLYALDGLYLPVVTPEGAVLFRGPDYGYDPATGQPAQLGATEAALATDDQQLYMMSAIPAGAAIDVFDQDTFDPNQTTPFPGTASRPVGGHLANGPVFTWIDAERLQFVYASQSVPTVLAEGVLDHDLATDGGSGMVVTWVETVPNPLSPDGSRARFTAYLSDDRTVLFDDSPSGASLASPRAAMAEEHVVVAHLEGGILVADVYDLDGFATVPLQVDAASAAAFDVAAVGDVAVVTWSGPLGTQVQLLDLASGLPITESVPTGDAGAVELRIDAVDLGELRFAIAARDDVQCNLFQGASVEALRR